MSQFKNFQLFICFNNNSADLNITSFKGGEFIVSHTFDEKFTEKEYGQCSLTFSAPLYIDDVKNPYIDYLVIDRKLKLLFDNRRVDFYITDRTPNFSSNNIKYNFTCQDAFSYELSHASSEISISTDDETITDWGGNPGPKTIQLLVKKVFEVSNSVWKLDNVMYENSTFYESGNIANNKQIRISLEINNSTPYNIITEIAKQFSAIVYVNYDTNQVAFLQNELTAFKGLFLRPETNLSNFTYSEKGSNLCNILRVFGSEAADGSYVSILPQVPSIISWVLDNDTDYKVDWNLKLSETNGNNIEYPLKDSLLSFINSYYPYKEKKEYEIILDEFNNYYERLLLVPCGASILYDFSYWYKKGLVDNTTKDIIEQSWSVDLRNLNIRYNALLPTYLKMKYEINRIEDQEQEYVARLAAESRSYATTEDLNLSSEVMYISQCIAVEKENTINYYLPVGELIKKNVEAGIEEKLTYFDYGKNQSSNISSLPDFSSFGAELFTNNLYYLNNSEFVKIDNSNGNLTQDDNIKKRFYIKSNDIAGKVYLLYNSIKDKISASINAQSNVSLHNSLRDEYVNNLQNLYDDNYYYLKYNIYGKNWCQDEISNYTELFNEKVKKQKEIAERLKNNFGDDWRSYNVSSTASSPDQNFILYTDLVEQYDNCSIYIGGIGTVKDSNNNFLTYEGRYDYYLKVLREQLMPGFNKWYESRKDGLENSQTISQKIEEAKENLNKWWSDWYSKYWYITREGKYEDSNQIDYKGLYAAAYLQFKINSKPEVSYNISYIKSEWIEDSNTMINVGDKIKLYQPNISGEYDKEQVEFVLNHNLKNVKNIIVSYYCIDKTKEFFFKPANFQIIDENKILINDGYIKEYWNNGIFINSIIIPESNIVFKFNNNSYKIIGVNSVASEQPVELRITGITHDLRSDIYQLQVSEYTMYKTLVDRLLSIIK